MGENTVAPESRIRVNIERTASNKVTRNITLRDGITPVEAEEVVNDAVATFVYLEKKLVEAGVTATQTGTEGR